MEKDYLDSMSQCFNDEATAKQFATMIGKYLPEEQIVRDGRNVTCNAKNKGESWFLVLFSMNVIMMRKGYPVPKKVQMCMANLAADFNNDAQVNLVEELFENVGLNQVKIMHGLEKL